jgi:hypothetical protein
MPTFTPPTYEYSQTVPGHPLHRLMRHYKGLPRGRNVYYLSDGTVTEAAPDSVTVFWTDQKDGSVYVRRVFWGSTLTPYSVSVEEAAALTAAGYTVSP